MIKYIYDLLYLLFESCYMNSHSIEKILSNSNTKDLIKIPDGEENFIVSLERLTIKKRWCYQNGCTTCGALGLGSNIAFFAMQKCEKLLDLNFIIEKKIRWLILHLMPLNIKNELIKVLCKELNLLKQEEIFKLNEEILRFIILEIWRAFDKNTIALLDSTVNPIRSFIQDMDNHYNKATSSWRWHYQDFY